MSIAAILEILLFLGERVMFGYCTKEFAEGNDIPHGFLWGLLLSVFGLIIVSLMLPDHKPKTAKNAACNDDSPQLS